MLIYIEESYASSRARQSLMYHRLVTLQEICKPHRHLDLTSLNPNLS